MKLAEKLKDAKRNAMTTQITSITMFIQQRDKVLRVIRFGTFASCISYIYSIWSGNMFFNIAGALLGFISLIVGYEFDKMTDTEREASIMLKRALNENYRRHLK